jgi:lysophospholipase L1-like esterase
VKASPAAKQIAVQCPMKESIHHSLSIHTHADVSALPATAARRPFRSIRRRRILMGSLTSVSVVMLLCAATEVALRITWERPSGVRMRWRSWEFMQKDAELGWVPRPDVLVKFPRFQASFRTNHAGFRGPEWSVARRPGRHRVLVLGDSFAWGHGVSAGQAFPELLERMLPNTEVINLGVPGFNLRTELRCYYRNGAQYAPDVVVVALCQNDICEVDPPGTARFSPAGIASPPDSSAGPQDAGSGLRPLKQYLDEHSYLYAMCCRAVNAHKPLARAAVWLGLKEELAGFELLDNNLYVALIDPPVAVERALAACQRDLLVLDESVRRNQSRLLLALVPALQAVDPNELAKTLAYTRYEPKEFDLDRPYCLLEEFAREHRIEVVNPLARFRIARDGGMRLYLPEDLHFSSKGHWLFAEAVAPALAAMLDDTPQNPGYEGSIRIETQDD